MSYAVPTHIGTTICVGMNLDYYILHTAQNSDILKHRILAARLLSCGIFNCGVLPNIHKRAFDSWILQVCFEPRKKTTSQFDEDGFVGVLRYLARNSSRERQWAGVASGWLRGCWTPNHALEGPLCSRFLRHQIANVAFFTYLQNALNFVFHSGLYLQPKYPRSSRSCPVRLA